MNMALRSLVETEIADTGALDVSPVLGREWRGVAVVVLLVPCSQDANLPCQDLKLCVQLSRSVRDELRPGDSESVYVRGLPYRLKFTVDGLPWQATLSTDDHGFALFRDIPSAARCSLQYAGVCEEMDHEPAMVKFPLRIQMEDLEVALMAADTPGPSSGSAGHEAACEGLPVKKCFSLPDGTLDVILVRDIDGYFCAIVDSTCASLENGSVSLEIRDSKGGTAAVDVKLQGQEGSGVLNVQFVDLSDLYELRLLRVHAASGMPLYGGGSDK